VETYGAEVSGGPGEIHLHKLGQVQWIKEVGSQSNDYMAMLVRRILYIKHIPIPPHPQAVINMWGNRPKQLLHGLRMTLFFPFFFMSSCG